MTTPAKRTAEGWSAQPDPVERTAPDHGSNGGASSEADENCLLGRSRAVPLGTRTGPSLTQQVIQKSVGDTVAGIIASTLNLSGAEKITRPYEESKWVHACIRSLSTTMMHAPLRFYLGDPVTAKSDEEIKELPSSSPLYSLFGMPNPLQTGMQFRESNLVHRKLDGETIWFLMDKAGKPLEANERTGKIPLPATIMAVRGGAVNIRKDSRGMPCIYIFPSKSRTEFPAESVVHFRDYDPNNPLRGLGDVEVLARDLAAEFQAQRYQEGLLGNGGDPGGWVTNKGSMSDPTRRAQEAAINDRYGNVENAGKWHVVSGDVTITPNKMNPKDMEYTKLREYTFKAVCAVLGVPTILLGDTASATFSNFDAAMRQLWTGPNGIIAYLRTEEDVMRHFFLERLDIPEADRLWARYDLSAVPELQEDNTDAVDKAAEIAARGIGISFNDAASTLGVDTEDIATGDLRVVDNKFKTVDEFESPAEPEPAPAKAPPPSDDGKEYTEAELTDALEEMLDEETLRRQAYVRAALDVVHPFENKLKAAVKAYLRKYELAQIKRVEQFAKTGKGLGAKAFDVADLTAKDLARLLLDPEEWADKLYVPSAPIIEASFEAALHSIESEIGLTGLTMEDPAVVSFLESQTTALSNGVGGTNGTLAKKVKKAMLNVFEQHAGTNVANLQEAVRTLLPELKGSLKRAFTDRDSRALTIAQTETGKASSGARYKAMKKSDVVEFHEWVTAGDGEVRTTHAEQNGDVVKVGDPFKNGLRYPLDSAGAAGEVINCYLPGTSVRGVFTAGLKSAYSGPAREIETFSGERISVTPNHPVLTDRGWIGAGDVREGDYLVRYCNQVEPSPRACPRADDRPSVVEDVFDALSVEATVRFTEVSDADLHGDALFADRYVEVVGAYRELTGHRVTSVSKRVGNHTFSEPNSGLALVHPSRSQGQGLGGVLAPASGLPGGGTLLLDGGSIELEHSPLDTLRVGSTTDLDAVLDHVASEHATVETHGLGEVLHAFPGLVSVDKVVNVRNAHFAGHVYDLRSVPGVMVAGNLVTSNCRCAAAPVIKDKPNG